MQSLGNTIRILREENDVPLRKVAAYLDIDQAILSKFEHGSRSPKREQVVQLAEFFKTDKKALLVQWLAEKILSELTDDEISVEALALAGETMKIKNGAKELNGHITPAKASEMLSAESSKWDNKLPSFMEIAQSLFNSLTGEKFSENRVNTYTGFIGESKTHEIYLFYKPNEEWLKNNALTLNKIQELPKYAGKRRLVCASFKYVNDETCKLHFVDFCKLPY
jgi:HTH-type transcriptional regulator, competence development regulator